MKARTKKLIGLYSLAAALSVTAAVVTMRAIRTDVDTTVSVMQENYVCASCGHAFQLTVAQAASMRRSRGGILCSRCGNPGAIKEASASAAAISSETADSESEEAGENGDPSATRPKKRLGPSATLSKKPKPQSSD